MTVFFGFVKKNEKKCNLVFDTIERNAYNTPPSTMEKHKTFQSGARGEMFEIVNKEEKQRR